MFAGITSMVDGKLESAEWQATRTCTLGHSVSSFFMHGIMDGSSGSLVFALAWSFTTLGPMNASNDLQFDVNCGNAMHLQALRRKLQKPMISQQSSSEDRMRWQTSTSAGTTWSASARATISSAVISPNECRRTAALRRSRLTTGLLLPSQGRALQELMMISATCYVTPSLTTRRTG